MKTVPKNMSKEMLLYGNSHFSTTRTGTVVRKLTYARGTFEGIWSLEWTI
jgi:hypothetical protein